MSTAPRRRRPEVATARGVGLVLGVSSLIALGIGGLVLAIVRDLDVDAVLAATARADRASAVPILVADLGAGTVVGPEHVGWRPFPRASVPAGAVLDPRELVGRTLVERVLAGEPVREERLAPPASPAGIGALVPPGQRAMSLDLGDDDRVSGFVEPGDRVDVIVTLPPDHGTGRVAETLTLLEAVRVLAVDERISETARGEVVRRPRVTVSLAPEEAERLAAVPRREGDLKLALRSPADTVEIDPAPVRVADLLGDAGERLTVAEYRERVTDAELARWTDMVAGALVVHEPIIDPARLRDPVLARRAR